VRFGGGPLRRAGAILKSAGSLRARRIW
jgi:hypothetical protein